MNKMNIYVVTYCPPFVEYRGQISIQKAFETEEAATEYIEKEKEKEQMRAGNNVFVGDYDIEEIEFIDG